MPLPSAIAAPPARLPVRARRLMADYQQLSEALAGNAMIRLAFAEGDPPELYRIEYLVKSIEKLHRDKPVFRESHKVELQMTRDYPRVAPHCRMLTPIFHPNIDESSICVGDHWVAGERLADLVMRIGEMIAYQAYNIKSPLNGQAAMWADLHGDQLPVDARGMEAAANKPVEALAGNGK